MGLSWPYRLTVTATVVDKGHASTGSLIVQDCCVRVEVDVLGCPGVLTSLLVSVDIKIYHWVNSSLGLVIVQELCESRGGRPELSVLTSLLVSVDVKI